MVRLLRLTHRRPSFNHLQNYGSSNVPIIYSAFDLLILSGEDLRSDPLKDRRKLLRTEVPSKLDEPIRYSPELKGSLATLVRSVREQKFEGLIAKRRDSPYEPGERTGAWLKMRVNQGQEFVIGGYTPGSRSFDALIFGYYEGGKLIYVGRTRNGFTPASRAQLAQRFRATEIPQCPFSNLPEASNGRWGAGFTAAKMKDCHWLKPLLVGQFEYAESTPDNHLRHSRFIGLREDKSPREVHKEV